MAPKNPGYDRILGMAPTFRWGGREWGLGDRNAFIKKMGRKKYERWARNHRGAARAFDPVEQGLYGMYKPQLDMMSRQREMEREYYDRLSRNLSGFTQALGGLLAGGGDAMRGLYNDGANSMTYSAGAYGQGLNADQAAVAGANNQVLGAIGAPEGAMQSGGDAGGVLAGVAGWLPSTMMGEQGQAWGERMDHFPQEAALQANLMMKDIIRQAAEADKEWSGKVSDVLSGMGASRMDMQDRLLSRKSAAQKERLAYLKFQSDQAYRAYLQAKGEGDMKRADEYLKIAQDTNRRLINESAGLDYYGNPKKEKPSEKSGPSRSDRSIAQKDIQESSEDIGAKIDAALKTGTYYPPYKSGPPKPGALSRKQFFLKLYREFKPLTRGSKEAQRLLRRMINEYLDAVDKGEPMPTTGSGPIIKLPGT